MKYNFVIRAFGQVLNGLINRELHDKEKVKNVQKEYKAIMLRSKDIGEKNIFVTSYAFGAYYLAMCRETHLTPEENLDVLSKGISGSKLFKIFLGNADNYLSEKRMNERKVCALESHKHK